MNITVTLFAQMIAFVAMIWLVNRFLWAPLSSMMEARRQRIADGLSASERGKHELKLAEERAVQIIKEAKEKATELMAQANSRSTEILDEARNTAKTEAERILIGAQAEIGREVERAKQELSKQVSVLAVTGAERILQREVDAKVHEASIADLVARI
ncbi:MAG: F0F1 ATP synthase subunit B [Pseudomonadota bacterium]